MNSARPYETCGSSGSASARSPLAGRPDDPQGAAAQIGDAVPARGGARVEHRTGHGVSRVVPARARRRTAARTARRRPVPPPRRRRSRPCRPSPPGPARGGPAPGPRAVRRSRRAGCSGRQRPAPEHPARGREARAGWLGRCRRGTQEEHPVPVGRHREGTRCTEREALCPGEPAREGQLFPMSYDRTYGLDSAPYRVFVTAVG